MTEEVKYIGPFKVLSYNDTNTTTPMGDKILSVTFERDYPKTPELWPEKVFNRVIKADPTDLTKHREERYQYVLNILTALLLEENLRHSDVRHVCTSLAEKVLNAFDRASNLLWTGDDSDWTPDTDFTYYRTILEADRIIKQYEPGNK